MLSVLESSNQVLHSGLTQSHTRTYTRTHINFYAASTKWSGNTVKAVFVTYRHFLIHFVCSLLHLYDRFDPWRFQASIICVID